MNKSDHLWFKFVQQELMAKLYLFLMDTAEIVSKYKQRYNFF